MQGAAKIPQGFREAVRRKALDLGFDVCRFTNATLSQLHGDRLEAFVAAGHHGTMQWMEQTLPRRRHPQAMWPHAQSAIMLGMNYGPSGNPLDILERAECGAISVYAKNRDYHDVIKGRLKTLAQHIAANASAEVKVFVDTAPLMEKPLAAQSGIGWQGKHTNLVSRQFGSWLFLGSVLTTAVLDPDLPEEDHCGSCRACLDICPTKAMPQPYQLDARRCISYLTIEHSGPLPHEFRRAMGNRIYGCDDCLAVCPWNKYAAQASEAKLAARDDLQAPQLDFLVSLDDAAFRAFFSGSPVKRIGRDRFLRNVLTAIGNSRQPQLARAVRPHLADASPVVRGAALWALSQLLEHDELRPIFAQMAQDGDASVRAEAQIASGQIWELSQ